MMRRTVPDSVYGRNRYLEKRHFYGRLYDDRYSDERS